MDVVVEGSACIRTARSGRAALGIDGIYRQSRLCEPSFLLNEQGLYLNAWLHITFEQHECHPNWVLLIPFHASSDPVPNSLRSMILLLQPSVPLLFPSGLGVSNNERLQHGRQGGALREKKSLPALEVS
jgi:hypothetical protein